MKNDSPPREHHTRKPDDPNMLKPWPVMLVVGVATLFSAMAGSSVNLALPGIRTEFAIPIDLTSWVMLSFLLVVTVLLLVAGRIADMVGHRRIFMAGMLVFGAASTVCMLAEDIWMLLFGRVLQGVAGAMTMASGPALLTTSFPPAMRGRALGTVATATYVGLSVGPPLGGWLIETFGWRALFFLNLPIAAVVLALGWYFLPRRPGRGAVAFDWYGMLLLLLGLPPALWALAEGHSWGWLSAPILAVGSVGLVLLIAFVVYELRPENPLLDLRLFRKPVFAGAAASAFSNYISLFVPIFLMPFFLIEGLGMAESRAGIVLMAQPVLMALVATPSGWLSDRIGTRWLAAGGLTLLAAGIAGMSTVGAETPAATVMVWWALTGLGTGIFISPNSSALMGQAPRHQQGVASGIMAVSRNMGMLIGVASATLIFQMAGGQTGHQWQPGDYHALHIAFRFAAAVSLIGAVAAAIRGRTNAQNEETA